MTKETIYLSNGTLKPQRDLECALKQGASPNEGWVALQESVVGGRMDALDLLVAHGADLEMQDGDGDTALVRACTTGALTADERVRFVECLISHGANVNHTNHKDETPLLHSVMDDNLDVVSCLLRHGANPKAASRWTDVTPLHRAGSVDVAKALHFCGAEIEAIDNMGQTPLLSVQSVDVAMYLIRAGANANARKPDGDSVFHFDFHEPQLFDMCKEIFGHVDLRNNEGCTPLHHALKYYAGDGVDNLLELGANPNCQSEQGLTSLHFATLGKQPGSAQLLLEHGADMSVRCSKGITALQIAMNTCPHTCAVLLAWETNTSKQDIVDYLRTNRNLSDANADPVEGLSVARKPSVCKEDQPQQQEQRQKARRRL